MGLEIATYINGLVETNPPNGDPLAQGDDHIRLLKAVLKASFPLVNGALNATMVPFTPAGNIVATNVAAALAELDSEKIGVNGALGTPVSGNLANCTFPTLNQNTTGTAANASAIADGAVSTSAKLASNVVTVAKLAREGTADQVLTSNGPGADPSYKTVGGSPVGAVEAYAGSTAPSGWLLCYGQAVSRTTYAALFAIVSTVYGVGDGSTTFNLPDLRGRVVGGKDNMGGTAASRLTSPVAGSTLGAVGGTQSHTLTTTEMPSHAHADQFGSSDAVAGAGTGLTSVSSSGDPLIYELTGTTFATGGGGAHNNVQPTIVLNYIIKT